MDLDEEIKSREEGEMAQKVGRREIYSPVPPPSTSALLIVNRNNVAAMK